MYIGVFLFYFYLKTALDTRNSTIGILLLNVQNDIDNWKKKEKGEFFIIYCPAS